MAYLTQIVAFVFLLCSFATADARTICNKTPYGRLGVEQCLALSKSFADGDDGMHRIFDEEQLQEVQRRSWPGIVNPFKTRVVQVPRFWTQCKSDLVWAQSNRYGSLLMRLSLDGCNIALMSYASLSALNDTSAVSEVSRVGVTSWRNIVESVATLLETCVVRERTGGAVILTSCEFFLLTIKYSQDTADTVVPSSTVAITPDLDDVYVAVRFVL